MRHPIVAIAAILVVTAVAAATDEFVVEDWKQNIGATGIPTGWQAQNWGSPKYDFKVEEHDGRPALHM